MKTKKFLLAIVVTLFTATLFADDTVKIMSINVRYGSANDGENAWPKRKEFMLDVVRTGEYDFIGGQEVLISGNPETNQVDYMTEQLPEYGVIVRSREVDEKSGESMPIFYKKSRFEPDADEKGTFWLSDTPEKVGSNTWNAACNRVVTWGRFHEIDIDQKRTGKSIYVFNTHYDHVSEEARQKSSLLIFQRIHDRKDKDAPVVLMGDFNSGQKSVAIRFLKGETVSVDGKEYVPPMKLVDTFEVVHPDETFVVTFNSFRAEPNKNGAKIDYIFVLPETKVTEAAINREKRDGRYPSDHFPVTATIKF